MASNIGISTSVNLPYCPDVAVECGHHFARREVNCHKAVICPRSNFLADEYIIASARGTDARNMTRIIIDVHYDGRAVEAVLKSLYKSEDDTAWLHELAWIELLRIFQVTHLFKQHAMDPIIRSIASVQLDKIVEVDQIDGALEDFRNVGHPSFMHGSFRDDVEKLYERRSALQKAQKEDTKRELADTMVILRDPATRGNVSEQAYSKFLDAVQSSNWAGGNQR